MTLCRSRYAISVSRENSALGCTAALSTWSLASRVGGGVTVFRGGATDRAIEGRACVSGRVKTRQAERSKTNGKAMRGFRTEVTALRCSPAAGKTTVRRSRGSVD